ncbi:hypothetical protein SBADM41S_05320 [Streptomyces badius]
MSTTASDPIRAYIVSEFLAGEDAEDLTDDFDLIESTVVNSLGLVRLISWISETYRIPVDDIPLERPPTARSRTSAASSSRPPRPPSDPTAPPLHRPPPPHAPAHQHTSRTQR